MTIRADHQPIIDLRTGRSVGAEVVLVDAAGEPVVERLDHDDRLVALAGRALDHLRQQLHRWDDAGIGPTSGWFHLRGPELDTDAFLDRIGPALISSPAVAARINLVIPEPWLAGADPVSLERLFHLAGLGVGLGLGGLGTAGTAVDRLPSLPLSFATIGPSVTRRVREPGGPALIDAVLADARVRDGDLDLIAQGVDDRAQLEVLARLGCTHVQGAIVLTLASGVTAPQVSGSVTGGR